MPLVRADALVGWVVNILPLKTVASTAIDEVCKVNEYFATQKTFPKIESAGVSITYA